MANYGWFGDVTVVSMDARQSDSAAAAFEKAGDIDVVYYLLHGIGEAGFRESDNRGAAHVAEAARAADVRRIVYLGGFVPGGDTLSEHLAGRAEVAEALHVPGGPEVVMAGRGTDHRRGVDLVRDPALRQRPFPVLPLPSWMSNPIDPISIQDVLYYLVAAADPDRVPAGSYDISGPETTTYRDLLATYTRLSGNRQLEIPVGGVPTALVSAVSAAVLPVPSGLTADLTASLDFPMTAGEEILADVVPEPAAGWSVSRRR